MSNIIKKDSQNSNINEGGYDLEGTFLTIDLSEFSN